MKAAFEAGSYGERCAAFFSETHAWEHPADRSFVQRVVTYARYPNRYWVTQYGSEVKRPLRQARIEHKMFEIALMSAQRSLDGMRNLEYWYVLQSNSNKPETLMYMEHVVDTPEQEQLSGELVKDFNFILDNGLYVPHKIDYDRLDTILAIGQWDGYEPFSALASS